MQHSPTVFLQHILESIGNIQEFLQNIRVEQFLTNRMIQSAVIRELEIVGEAVGKLEDEFRESHPNVPWRMIVAMRNRLTHEYWDTDLVKIYNICTGELVLLKNDIETILVKIGQ